MSYQRNIYETSLNMKNTLVTQKRESIHKTVKKKHC